MQTHANDSIDPGIFVLDVLLHLLNVESDYARIRRQFGRGAVGAKDLVRYARGIGLKACLSKSEWRKLAGVSLPAIAVLHGGSFLLLGKITGDKAVVLTPGANRPVLMTQGRVRGSVGWSSGPDHEAQQNPGDTAPIWHVCVLRCDDRSRSCHQRSCARLQVDREDGQRAVSRGRSRRGECDCHQTG